jgi:hypothetical protein
MEAERAIGSIESSFLLIHDHFGGSYTGAAAVKIVGRLEADLARTSARALARKHPLLRARLFFPEDRTTPHFVVDADVDLESLFRFEPWPDGEWQALLEDAIVAFTSYDAPLWRARLLSSPRGDEHLLLVAAHHTIADALSLTYLVKAFLVNCARLLRGEALDDRPLELLPSIESLAEATREVKRDWSEIFRVARAHLGPSEFRYPSGSPHRAARTGIESTLLAEERVSAILAACKAQKTPLTGLITASLCQAVQEVFSSSGDFVVACPMSCRAMSRKVRLDDTRFGSYTRVAYVHSPPAELWPRATRISQRLDVLSKAATFTKTVRFRGAERVFRTAARVRRRGFTDMAVSNLGIVDFPKSAFAPLSVEWLRLGANLNSAFEMFLLGACVVQKRLSLNLSFPEPHMPREKARATFDALVRILTGEGSRAS